MSKLVRGENDLATLYPDLASQWHPTNNGDLQPSDVTSGSGKKVWWQCEKGHEWQETIANRAYGNGCPICSGHQVLTGYNDLATLYPKLAKEWHPEKNGDLTPQKITCGSKKKIWWQCEKGHECETTISHRREGNGCPVCSGKKVLSGYNDLATLNPELAAEWHPTKNGELSPAKVQVCYAKKVWWQCKEGHEWQASVAQRTSHNSGCPYCSGRYAIVGKNDLATTHPVLAAEWHPTKNGSLKPTDVKEQTNKKVWWLGKCGHEWQTSVSHRANRGTGCPYCAGQEVLPGFNDLASLLPELATEWHPTKNGDLTPYDFTCGSGKKVWWQCEKGHEWQASIDNRVKGRGCPECGKESKTSFAEQTIFYYFNKIAIAYNRYLLNNKTEIDVYLPDYKFGIEYDGFYHQSLESKQRDEKKDAVLAEENIFLVRVIEVDKPLDFTESNNRIYCKPSSNQTYLNVVIEKILNRFNSFAKENFTLDINIERDRWEIYSQYIETEKKNNVFVLFPEIAAEWHPTKNGTLSPLQVTPGSNKSVWWLCKHGHEWEAKVVKRTYEGTGCPYCAGQKAISGVNDLETLYPKLAAEWHPTKNNGLLPSQFKPGSGKKVWWQCEKGHEWEAKICDRLKGSGCPICFGRKKLIMNE